MNNEYSITNGPKHHFFGFHDILAWNKDGNRLVCLEVDRIDHPPLPGQQAVVGYVDMASTEFVKMATTSAFNYPQAARQQWLGNSNNIIFNANVNDTWGSEVYDTNSQQCVQKLTSTVHIYSSQTDAIFGLNYARLNRLGGYGYNGLPDKTEKSLMPSDDGIFINNITKDNPELLISITDVVSVDMPAGSDRYNHYLTHLFLSPKQDRMAFLHRYKTPSSEITRLMTVGVDGSGIRCLGTGFLSHFDWIRDDAVVIWGRIGSSVDNVKNSRIANLMPASIAIPLKKIVKTIIGKKTLTSNFKWHVLQDCNSPQNTSIADGVIVEDGHPMFCPINRDWMICDNYPDKQGVRTLFLYQVSTNEKIVLGKYKYIAGDLDIDLCKRALESVDRNIMKASGFDLLSFTRSGFHCDLHPRWDRQGKKIAFDSTHEGSRQIYVCDVESIIS